MFVEPRQSYSSIVQAIGRVLRYSPAKALAHIVLPAVVVPTVKSAEGSSEWPRAGHDAASDQDDVSLSNVLAHRSGMKSLGGYACSLSSPHENGAQMANKFKSTADIFDSLSRQLVEQEASPGSRPSQARHGNRKVPETSFLKGFVHGPQQRAVPSRREEKQGELSGNWNSVTSVDSLQLNSWGKPASSGQAQLPDSLSQAGAGSSNIIISRSGASTSQNADTVGPETEAARPGGSRSRYREADPLDGIRRNGRTKPTRPEVREQPNLASKERGCSDEEARHSDAFANRSPSPTGNTKQDTQQTPPSLATEAQPHRMMRVAFRREKQTRLLFGSSDGFEACDKKYENQLERFLNFLGALVQADHRLIGADAAAGHRIQIVDCSLGLEGELGVDGFMKEVYGRLDAVLSQRDAWETRFRELEAFAEKNEKLPRQGTADCDRAEAVLRNWLITQTRRVRLQQMPAHQLQRLLNARSDHIRRRAEGWMAGGLVGRFKQNCRELKAYIEMNGKLPTETKSKRNSSYRLSRWLTGLRCGGSYAKPERRKMLEEVHPLVKELLQKWDHKAVKIDLARWKKQLEKVLHIVEKHGRLPKVKTERTEYRWLGKQLRRLDTLPPELAKRLCGSHPWIAAEAARTSQGRNKKGRYRSDGFWLPVQRIDTSASNIRISEY